MKNREVTKEKFQREEDDTYLILKILSSQQGKLYTLVAALTTLLYFLILESILTFFFFVSFGPRFLLSLGCSAIIEHLLFVQLCKKCYGGRPPPSPQY